MDFELTSRCAGSCAYCIASSTNTSDNIIPTRKVMEVIDDAAMLGVKVIDWAGGDPLLHPDWADIVSYAAEKGIHSWLLTSDLISQEGCRKDL